MGKKIVTIIAYAVLVALLVVFYLVSRSNYLLFHGFVELFSVVISGSIFMLAWISRKKQERRLFVFLGIAYLFVGTLDFFHTLSYAGMNLFKPGVFYANQLWVCARFLESVTLVVFTFHLARPFPLGAAPVLVGYSGMTALALASVFVFEVFPVCFIAGQGQTPFKIGAEYVICSLLSLALVFLWRRKSSLNPKTFKFLVASLVTTILSEFCFTLYTDNFGLTNVFGHLLKVVSFYFIYRSMVLVSIEEPFDMIYSDLHVQLGEVNRLNREIQAREALARNLSERLEGILDHLPAMVFYKDRENRFIQVNRNLALAHGKEKHELLNCRMEELYPPEDAARYYQDDLAVLASGKPKLDIEEPWVGVGGARWLSTSKIPFVDVSGETVGIIGISLDITERRRSEEKIRSLLQEKELLLKEVHHRIKNNLNTVYGLMVLQVGAVTDPQAVRVLEDSANRVLSMAVLYDKLYRSNDVTEVAWAEYLPALLNQVVGLFPNGSLVHLETRIGDFTLDAKTTQTLGIILNELLTNIMKYAFLGQKAGTIAVEASLDGGLLTVVLKDDGQGLPETVNFDRSSGFGLMLVGTLMKDLGGTISVDRAQGTTITMSVPVRG